MQPLLKPEMKQQKHHTQQALRFRRWSRAAYAMFMSMSAVVSIGFLSTSVSEMSLIKNENYTRNSVNASSSLTDDDSEGECQEEFLASLQEIIVITNSSDETAACTALFLFISLTQPVKAGCSPVLIGFLFKKQT